MFLDSSAQSHQQHQRKQYDHPYFKDGDLVIAVFPHKTGWYSLPRTDVLKNYFICEKFIGREEDLENLLVNEEDLGSGSREYEP